jgi:hypothetical protein
VATQAAEESTKKKLTEERRARLSLVAENEQLRRRCGELQRVLDRPVQFTQDVSEVGVAEAPSSKEDGVPATRVPTKKKKWYWFPKFGQYFG